MNVGGSHDSFFIPSIEGAWMKAGGLSAVLGGWGLLRLDSGHSFLTLLGPRMTVASSRESNNNQKHSSQGRFPNHRIFPPNTHPGPTLKVTVYRALPYFQKTHPVCCGSAAFLPRQSLLSWVCLPNPRVPKWSFSQRGLICKPYNIPVLKEWKECLLLITTFTAPFLSLSLSYRKQTQLLLKTWKYFTFVWRADFSPRFLESWSHWHMAVGWYCCRVQTSLVPSTAEPAFSAMLVPGRGKPDVEQYQGLWEWYPSVCSDLKENWARYIVLCLEPWPEPSFISGTSWIQFRPLCSMGLKKKKTPCNPLEIKVEWYRSWDIRPLVWFCEHSEFRPSCHLVPINLLDPFL